ncbi:MAG: TonB-dependent receptor [Steroidobacteraceae bacterium]
MRYTQNVLASQRRSPLVLTIAALLATGAAHAQQSSPATSDDLQEIVVFGRGESRQVQTIGETQLEQLTPGTSPIKAIEKLPGVNFQSADPYGAYEWSTRITVRGFNQNQMGFTLDGVPLGDMSYGNHNGLHVSRAVSSENVAGVALSQGTGALATASTSNLGGTLEFRSADPGRELGVRAALTGGSDSTQRGFLRFDSGEFAAGTRLFASYTNQEADKWKGGGVQKQEQINFKIVQPLGAATLTGYYASSDRAEQDYQDLSLDMIRRRGYENDNFFPDWAGAIAAANACAAAAFNAPICDDQYWNASGLRKDDLAYVALALPFSDTLSWDTTVYLHQNEGQGLWGTPYTPTPGGAPLSVRTTEYDIERNGLTTALTWAAGNHEVNGGVWYEDNDFNQARRFYGEPSAAAPTRSFLDFQSNPFFTQWQYKFNTRTLQWHLQDTWSVSDALSLNFGFKSVVVKNEATPVLVASSSVNQFSQIESKESFLPQVGFTYSLSGGNELFGGYSENMRAFVSAATAGPFGTTQAGFNAISDTLQPETSKTLELGWRFRNAALQGVVSAYLVQFDDRLLSISLGAGIVGAPAALANVGKVESIGIETGLLWQFADRWSLFGSYSYNDSQYKDDVVSGTGAITPTSGKQVVDAPKNMLKAELGYDNGNLFYKLGLDFVDDRYFSYLNDQLVDSRTLLDLSLGYRFRQFPAFKELTAQFNVANLTDEQYISTIGSNGFGNSGDSQTLLTGAPRQYFFTLNARF